MDREARARFGDLLDEAERGERVVIERRGIRFTITAEPGGDRTATRGQVFSFVHADVMRGEWTWAAGKRGLTFRRR